MKPQRVVNDRRKNCINMTNQLRERRIKCELTQEALSGAIEIPRGTYATLEAGASLPTTRTLRKLCSALECDDIQLYTGVYLDIIKVESVDA